MVTARACAACVSEGERADAEASSRGITHPFPSLNTCSARRDDGALRGAWLDCTERRGAARSAMRREEVGGVIKRRPRNGVGEVMCCAVCGEVAPSAP